MAVTRPLPAGATMVMVFMLWLSWLIHGFGQRSIDQFNLILGSAAIGQSAMSVRAIGTSNSPSINRTFGPTCPNERSDPEYDIGPFHMRCPDRESKCRSAYRPQSHGRFGPDQIPPGHCPSIVLCAALACGAV